MGNKYYEIHISKRGVERLRYIGVILLLIIVAFVSSKLGGDDICVACEPIIIFTQAPPVTANVVVEPVIVEEVPEEYFVDMQNMNFAPKELIVREGSLVTYRNKEKSLMHKIYEIHKIFLSPQIKPGETFTFQFNETGSYPVYSIIGLKAGMKMTVEVIE